MTPNIRSFTNLSLSLPEDLFLTNGIPYKVIKDGSQDLVRIDIYVTSGECSKQFPLLGMATNALITAGSQMQTAQDIAERIDFLGARLSPSQHINHLRTTIYSLNKNFKEMMFLFYDCFTSPSFEENEIKLFKLRTKSAIHNAQKNVLYMANLQLSKEFYGNNHPMAKFISDEDINCLTRKDILNYYKLNYHPANIQIILSGNITDAEIEVIEQTFGSWDDKTVGSKVANIAIQPSNKYRITGSMQGAVQAGIVAAIESIGRAHPDYIPLRILITALGGYFGSRLSQNIREDKGYTYGINSLLLGFQDYSQIQISTQCDLQYIDNVIVEIENEINRLKAEPIPDEELNIVKSHILSELAKSLDSAFTIADYAATIILYNTSMQYFNDQYKIAKAVTAQELQEVAKKYLDISKMYVSIYRD